MFGKFDNVKIQGMAAAVPEIVEDNRNYASVLGERRIKKQIRLTGVSQRRVSSKYQRTSDLCYTAAAALLDKLQWKREEIKIFIMVTQTPNYNVPSTSFFLQQRLGLGKDCVVFDINLGCSSFNAGVHVVSALLQSCQLFDKALLVVGDTSGTILQPQQKLDADVIADRVLFGSAGAAIALEKVEKHSLYFMNRSDGTGFEAIIGYPGRPTVMDGPAVFEFAINDVADDVKAFKKQFALQEEDIDFYVFHQAQKLILDNIIASCDIPEEKELRSLEKFGNTSGTSVPVSVCANVDKFRDKDKVNLYLCGFGVGLSWGSIYTEVDTENILPIIETSEHFDEDKKPGGQLQDKHILVIGADKPMGEHISRYMDDFSVSVMMCGENGSLLEEISQDLFMDSYVLQQPAESEDFVESVVQFCETHELQIDGIVVSDESVDAEQFGRWAEDGRWQECLKQKASIVFMAQSKTEQSDQWQQALSLWQKLLTGKDGRVNVFVYTKDNMDLRQITGDGYQWVEQYLQEGCPREMKQSIHIGNAVKQLLDDNSMCVTGNVIRTK